ncbi:PKD domain-containing protein [Reichenbachiella sp. MALMAid0571]|uniref:PKD domain-containing protein n=1 Tax=Reichenbachiella sp. MALMAid0571 TaxID=3143939 RepID=UPI0032DE6401
MILSFRNITILFFSIASFNASGQLTASFDLPSTVCLNQQIEISNTTINGVNYQWDFCMNDLDSLPQYHGAYPIDEASFTADIEIVFEEGQWYGYVTDFLLKKVFRLDYGDNLDNSPVLIDLGNPNNLLNSPYQMRLYKDQGIWYGFIVNSGNNLLIRWTFGDGLDAPPSITESLGNFGSLSRPYGIQLIKENDQYIAVIPNNSNNSITLINFGTTLSNTPTIGDAITIGNEIGLSAADKISIIETNGSWYGLICSSGNNKIFRIEFGSTLFDTNYTFTDIGTVSKPFGIELIQEGLSFYGLVVGQTTGLYRINFGIDIESVPTIESIGKLDIPDQLRTLKVIRESPRWHAYTTSRNNGIVSRIDFNDQCTGNLASNTETEPQLLTYDVSGTFAIELTAFSSNGNLDVASQTIAVLNGTAPNISFSTSNQCIANTNTFTTTDNGDISSYSWDFNADGIEDSNEQNPNFQFGSIGTHDVKLVVQATNGCFNNTTQEVILYPEPPTPSFEVDSELACSNTELSFNNLSDESAHTSESISYLWDFDGESTSTEVNPAYTFDSGGTKQISLSMSIPGCESFFSQNVEVITGPGINFSYTNNCFGEEVQFINNSETTNTSVLWDFGDGSPTTSTYSPQHLYTLADDYIISLSVTDNNNGCISKLEKNININDQPLVEFLYDSPIVENLTSQFYGQDLTLEEDNIIQWNWKFGNSFSSSDKTTQITFSSPDTVEVSLSVTTAQGCSDVFSNNVIIQSAEKPLTNFDLPNTACLNEQIEITNTTINGVNYQWDFCMNDLDSLPENHSAFAISEASFTADIDIVFEEGQWHGYVTDFLSKKVFRLDYGNNLDKSPILTDLGNPNDLLNNPNQMRLYKDQGIWYGFIVNSGNNLLIRWTFGDGLDAPPSITESLGNFGSLSRPYAIQIIKAKDQYIAVISNNSSNNITLINFGATLSNNPSVADAITIGNDIGLNAADKISIIETNGLWYGLICSYGQDKIFRIEFGSTLFDLNYTYTDLGTVDKPFGIELIQEGLSYYGLVAGQNTGFYRINFGTDLEAIPTIESLGELDITGQFRTLKLVRDSPGWHAYTTSRNNGIVSRIDFNDQCSGNLASNIETEPQDITYDDSGTFAIELTAFSSNGNFDVSSQTITVIDSQAPEISFSIDDSQCIANTNTFTTTDNVGISSYSWDFNNDGIEDSNEPNPNFQFGSIGTQDVKLVVQATNGCFNNTTQQVVLYPEPPTPDFEIETELVCSNTELSFNNLSNESDHTPEIISYLWDFDGESTSAEANPAYTFSTGGTKQISLTMSIPGCESFFSQNVEVIAGPSVDFDVINDCEGVEIYMNNQTTGESVSEFLWDFGDGFTNTTENPSHAFQSADDYVITLSSTNDMGCTNVISKPLTVYSLPTVSFTAEAGCENLLLQFTDESLADNANITAWNWDFDGLGSATNQNPEFKFETAGEYEVTLSAETNFGCLGSVQQMVTIAPSPVVNFTSSIGCLNELTFFTDITTTDVSNPITSWYWEIDGKIFTEQNPQYAFKNSGTYDIALTVTPQNNCAIKFNKEVYIENLPSVDFSASRTCDNEFTVFTDLSLVETSPIISRIWDFDGLATANGSQAVFNFPQSGIYDVSLMVINENGCTNQITKSIEIFAAPTAIFSTDVNFGAPPLEVNFTNNSTGADRYTWDFSDVANSSSSQTNPSFIFNEVRDYNVRLIAENNFNCSDTTYAKIVSTMPKLDLELVEIEPSLNNGKINLSLTVSNSGTVKIDGFDVTVEIENSFSISESYSGSLNASEEIIYPLNFEIPSTSSNIGFICIRLEDLISNIEDANTLNNEKCTNFDQEIVIENPYPNPAEDAINFRIILPTKSTITLSLLNIHGKTVYNESFPNISTGLNTFSIDIANFNTGMYFLKINTLETEEIKRIIKF